MKLTAGMKLGNFTVVEQIGAGGMSEVYLVRDNLDRLFALKTMSASLTSDPAFRQRFEQEARIMASLNHANITKLHSYFEAEGRYCLVTEYVPGGSLRDLVKRVGPIPEKRALPILRQIASALAYAHSMGIIHRDVKPSNILIDEFDQVKVMDFGIARMAQGGGLTLTGTQIGTLIYMSPEQIRDSKHVDEKTDVYSLGATFYEMLSGKPPYDEAASSDFDIRESIIYKELPDPRKIYPRITDATVALLKAMTTKATANRLSMRKMVQRISGFDPGDPITIGNDVPPTRDDDVKKRGKKSPWLRVALIVVALAAAGLWYFNRGGAKESTPGQKLRSVEMVIVQGGTFLMGTNSKAPDERPVHKVSVSSFYLGKHEVTQKEWKETMGTNRSHFKGDNLPVQAASWYDAMEFCNRRSESEGLAPCYTLQGETVICDWNANGYRLPTEAEWEYAARGGMLTKGHKYSGSDDPSMVAWHSGNSGQTLHSGGSKLPNELGIFDMSGNLWEWCWDTYNKQYYSVSPVSDPKGAGFGTTKVVRGGYWGSDAVNCAVSARGVSYDPRYWYYGYGIRLARSRL